MFRGTENFTCDHSKVSVFDLLLNAGTFCITYSVLYCCRNLIFYVISGSSFLSLASLLYVDYVLLVAIILHQLLFTNPVFPTLPRKIPPIFPVNGVIVKELPYGKADSSYTFTINTNVDITNETIARQNNFTVTKLVVKVQVPDTNVYTDVEVDLPNTVITIQ